MEKAIIYYVDDKVQHLEAVLLELSRRYTADYEVLGDRSPVVALHQLEQWEMVRSRFNPSTKLWR